MATGTNLQSVMDVKVPERAGTASAVERAMPQLVEWIDINTLSPHLMARGMLTSSDFTRLRARLDGGAHQVAVMELVVLLKSKGPGWERELVSALLEAREHRGHACAAAVIAKHSVDSSIRPTMETLTLQLHSLQLHDIDAARAAPISKSLASSVRDESAASLPCNHQCRECKERLSALLKEMNELRKRLSAMNK